MSIAVLITAPFLVTAGVLAQTSALLSGTDSKAPAKADSGGLEEVIVSAQRREEKLQNVPTSITAISAKDLEQQGITTITGIANVVPGLQVGGSDTHSFFAIRGVTQNDYADHEESPIAVYVDGAYKSQSTMLFALLFDTERVEVLRGPQGTLFGRNATGGLVQYISKQPTDDPDGYASVTLGNYSSKHFEGAIGDKIADGLTFRVSTALDYADGYLTNALTGEHPNNSDSWAVRGQLRFQPNSELQIDTNVHAAAQHIHAGFYKNIATYPDPANHGLATWLPANLNFWGSCPGCDPAGYRVPASYNFFTQDSTYPGHDDPLTVGDTTTIKYSAGKLNVTSIADVNYNTLRHSEDSVASAIREVNFISADRAVQYSEELHVDNGSKDRLRWIAGAYFLHVDADYNFGLGIYPALLAPLGLQGVIPNANQNAYTIVTRSLSEFAQGEYDIFEKLTAVLGFRWSQENKSFDYRYSALLGNAPDGPLDPGIPPVLINPGDAGSAAKVSEGDWSARVALNWHLTDAVMSYVTWNKGTKAGGFNAPTFPLATVVGYKFGEEKLYDTEIGVKGDFLERKFQVNADVFYYNYVGYQAFNKVNFNYYITNLPSKISGGEIFLSAAPIAGLRLDAGVALLHATTYDIVLPDGIVTSRVNAMSPRVSLTGSAAYRWPIANGGAVDVGAEFSYRSSTYYTLLNDPAGRWPGYSLYNAHLNYDTQDGHWTFQARVENLFDKEYITNLIPQASFGETQGQYGMPRTFEFGVKYRL
jgi:iron complex outermembrane recepter protein